MLNVAGMILELIGVLMLFQFGMPRRIPTGGYGFISMEGPEAKELAKERLYWWLGLLGLALVVFGTAMQIWDAWP
jgi:hypothetical protein